MTSASASASAASSRHVGGSHDGEEDGASSGRSPTIASSVMVATDHDGESEEEMIEVEIDLCASDWECPDDDKDTAPHAAVPSSCGGRLGWSDVLICEECGKCCDSVREYMVHRGTIQCQIDAARQTFTRTDETPPTGAFECPDCLECFEWQRQLRHHRRGECPGRRASSTRERATAERVREPVRAGVGKGGRGGEVVCVRAHVLVRV